MTEPKYKFQIPFKELDSGYLKKIIEEAKNKGFFKNLADKKLFDNLGIPPGTFLNNQPMPQPGFSPEYPTQGIYKLSDDSYIEVDSTGMMRYLTEDERKKYEEREMHKKRPNGKEIHEMWKEGKMKRLRYKEGKGKNSPLYSYAVGVIRRILEENPAKLFTSEGMFKSIKLKILNDIGKTGGKTNIDRATPIQREFLKKWMEILTWYQSKPGTLLKRHLFEDEEWFFWSHIKYESGYNEKTQSELADNFEELIIEVLDDEYPTWVSDIREIEHGEPGSDDDDDHLPNPQFGDEPGKKHLPENSNRTNSPDLTKYLKLENRVAELEDETTLQENELKQLQKQVKNLERTQKVEFTIITNKTKQVIKGNVHSVFPELLFHIECGDPIMMVGPSGCISGKAHIPFGVVDPNGGLRPKPRGGTLRNLYERFNDIPQNTIGPPRIQGSDLQYAVKSMDESGRLITNLIRDVQFSGYKKTWEIVTKSGKVIEATEDHEFLTENGYEPLCELSARDKVYINPGRMRHKKKTYRPEVLVKYHPNATVKIVNGCAYFRVRVYRAIYEAKKNGLTYEKYIRLLNTGNREKIRSLWTIPEGYDIHHKDDNYQNNDYSNLCLVTGTGHKMMRAGEVVLKTISDRIKSIRYAGMQKTYDIVCDDPHRNFVANGFVVHNCGKTEVSKQIAAHLKREFGLQSLSGGITESKLIGRSTPNINTGKSEYQGTKFVELCEKGGVFLLDEVDGGDSNVLLCLNSALSNRWFSIDRAKNPIIKLHEKFVCLAAANTWGAGADRQYVGRNQLDGAFVKRFVQIEMDYDEKLEFALCPGQEEFVERLHRIRRKIRENRLERVLDTRFILRAYNWLLHGKDEDWCEEKLFVGWRPDEIKKVRGA